MFLELVFVIEVGDIFSKVTLILLFLLSFGVSEERRSVFLIWNNHRYIYSHKIAINCPALKYQVEHIHSNHLWINNNTVLKRNELFFLTIWNLSGEGNGMI